MRFSIDSAVDNLLAAFADEGCPLAGALADYRAASLRAARLDHLRKTDARPDTEAAYERAAAEEKRAKEKAVKAAAEFYGVEAPATPTGPAGHRHGAARPDRKSQGHRRLLAPEGSDMSEVPHVRLGQKATAEVHRIVETYLHEHGDIVIGTRLTVALCNKAIDWWNALDPQKREELTP